MREGEGVRSRGALVGFASLKPKEDNPIATNKRKHRLDCRHLDKKYAGAEVQIEYTLIGLFHKQTSDKNKNTRRKSPFESSSITDILDNDVINTNPRVGNIEPD